MMRAISKSFETTDVVAYEMASMAERAVIFSLAKSVINTFISDWLNIFSLTIPTFAKVGLNYSIQFFYKVV